MRRTVTRAVVVMGKLPVAGRVKTRMCPPLDPAQSADLYRAFLLDVFQLVDDAVGDTASRVFHCALADEDHLADAVALAPAGWQVVRQGGGSLGERIEHARQSGGCDHVVVLGSDAPTMKVTRIRVAFESLDAGARAVFGPTEDGGYDLVGFSGAAPELLVDIPWSTPAVMAETIRAAERAHVRIQTLEPGYDVDHFEDLPRALADARRYRRDGTARAIERVLASVPSGD